MSDAGTLGHQSLATVANMYMTKELTETGQGMTSWWVHVLGDVH